MVASVWSHSSVIFVCATLIFSRATSTPLQHPKRQDAGNYDFIIVGGGTAGLALATRLSENGTHSVLVLEAGGKPSTVAPYQTPGADLQVLGSPIDWAYGTLPQAGLNGRQLTYNQGRCLGGSSAINGLAYGRGSSSIYDLWASLGNSGWSWEEVFPYFKKSTTANEPSAMNITAQGYDASLYAGGPVQLTYPPYVYSHPGSEAFVESLSAIGLSKVEDLNNGNNVGTKQEQFTMDTKYRRSSSYDSYYMQARDRPNLKVLELSPVQQIILEGTGEDMTASGVVYIDYASGQTINATANKEVIMSAGSIKTPQLLMLSGIGPAKTLAKAGIQQKVVNENVGLNMQDHIYLSVIAEADPSISYSSLYHDYAKLQHATEEYQDATGPLTAPVGMSWGFESLSSAQLASLNASAIIAQNRSDQAHIEYLYETIFYPNLPTPYYSSKEYNTSYVSFTAAIIAPTSRGSVSVLTNSIADPPQIDPNYYATPEDQALALYSFKNLRKVLAQYATNFNFTVGPNNGEVAPGMSVQSDEDIMNYIRETAVQVWHASGTCAMLPREDGGVVDELLKVYGVKGLRIVDASVFPVIPDAHTVGPTYMVAEKAAAMIKAEYGA
ncbi:GMC oxidoreductase [Dothidotthia symphoricarpi CBS 119687]|uniref:GMC oxidoreductase n=1 Tax=Dothidotthia symphoricarpi CBS 119687 TaxID=1392245 RepID=A0A6A6AJZ7_9PLEO|nr:GMC oxidoreductase [Dothidotthia symphoricarpi CBS 119687]KAF2131244.1 GMC oxidoreductase [Dothidotthia symphoricarpi CBS 119687]